MMRRTFLTSALDMPEIMSYIYSKQFTDTHSGPVQQKKCHSCFWLITYCLQKSIELFLHPEVLRFSFTLADRSCLPTGIQILLNMLQTIDLVLYIAGWHPTENHIIVLACQIGIHSFHYPVSKRN